MDFAPLIDFGYISRGLGMWRICVLINKCDILEVLL